jgi:hypothetical protein
MTEEKEWFDPIVADVRAIRDRLAKQCNYDVATLFERLREKDDELRAKGFEVVSLPIKRVLPKKNGTQE